MSYSLLLIEDNPGDALLITKILQRENDQFNLAHRENFATGFTYISDKSPDIILLDLGLPDIDGIDAIPKILAVRPNACIVVNTGHDDLELSNHAIRIGAQDYITKGTINGPVLVKTLLHAYQRNQFLQRISDQKRQLNEIYETVGVSLFKLIIIDNDQYEFEMVNQEYASRFNKNPEEIIGQRFDEIIPPSQLNFNVKKFKEAIVLRKSISFEAAVKFSEEFYYGLVSITPHFNPDGICNYLIGSIQNLTEIKNAQIKLEENEAFLSTLFEESMMAKLLTDSDGNIVKSNKAAAKIFGIPFSDHSNPDSNEFNYPKHLHKSLKQHLKESWEKETDYGEWEIIDGNGLKRTLIYSSKVLSSNLSLSGYIDITEKKIHENEIRKLSMIARETVNGVIITDENTKIVWVNKSFSKITGYSQKEVFGKHPGKLLQGKHTDEKDKLFIRKRIKEKKSFSRILLNYNKEGELFWVKLQGKPMFDRNNVFEGFFATQTDITKDINQRNVITSIKNKLEFALNTANIGIYDWNLRENNTTIYGSYYKVLGHTSESWTPGESLEEMCHPVDLEKVKQIKKGILSGNIKKFEIDYRIYSKDNHFKWIRESAQIFNEEDGKHIVGLIQDVTLQFTQQRILLKATLDGQEKERARISADIHDGLQQVLLGSLLSFRYFKKVLPTENGMSDENLERLDSSIEMLNNALEESRLIAHNLMPKSVTDEGISGMIQSLIDSLKLGFNIYYSQSIEESILSDQVIITLFRIVQEALSNVIKHANPKEVNIHLNSSGQTANLTIEDDGIGMKYIKTDKTIGILSMENRAKSLGGELEIDSSPGKGTLILVRIPL